MEEIFSIEVLARNSYYYYALGHMDVVMIDELDDNWIEVRTEKQRIAKVNKKCISVITYREDINL